MKSWLFALQMSIIRIRARTRPVRIFIFGFAGIWAGTWAGAARAQQPDSSTIHTSPMTAVRSSRPAPSAEQLYYITDAGREGVFKSDPVDHGTADDSAMTLVTASGLRLKRVTDGRSLNVRWFGATGSSSGDDWPAI